MDLVGGDECYRISQLLRRIGDLVGGDECYGVNHSNKFSNLWDLMIASINNALPQSKVYCLMEEGLFKMEKAAINGEMATKDMSQCFLGIVLEVNCDSRQIYRYT